MGSLVVPSQQPEPLHAQVAPSYHHVCLSLQVVESRDWTNSVTVMVAHFGLAMTGFDSRHEEISRRVVSGSQFGMH